MSLGDEVAIRALRGEAPPAKPAKAKPAPDEEDDDEEDDGEKAPDGAREPEAT